MSFARAKRIDSNDDVNTASAIRRQFRPSKEKAEIKTKIANLYKTDNSDREMYRIGAADGIALDVSNTVDILFSIKEMGLGKPRMVQVSNSHILLKVFDCICCRENARNKNCHYLAGYIGGALQAIGKPNGVQVTEVSCGEYPGRTCVFVANW